MGKNHCTNAETLSKCTGVELQSQSTSGIASGKECEGNKKGFHGPSSSKRKSREHVCPLLNEVEDWVTKDMEGPDTLCLFCLGLYW